MRSRWLVRYASTMSIPEKIKALAIAKQAVENVTAGESGSVNQVKLHPNSYIGVHTKYGWGLIPPWLYGIGTIDQINLLLTGKFAKINHGKVDKLKVQLAIDDWITESQTINKLQHQTEVKESAPHRVDTKPSPLKIEKKPSSPKAGTQPAKTEKPFPLAGKPFYQAFRTYITKEINQYKKCPDIGGNVELTFPHVDVDIDECLRLYNLKLRSLPSNLTIDYSQEEIPHPQLEYIHQDDIADFDFVDPSTNKRVTRTDGYRYFWAYNKPKFSSWPSETALKFIASEWKMLSDVDQMKFTQKYVQLLQKDYILVATKVQKLKKK